MNHQYQIVLCTCPDTTIAKHIARQLLEQRLAACINIIPHMLSIYHWQNNIEEQQELLLIIKTQQQHYAALEQLISNLHPYQVPEIITIPIQHGLPAYLQWLNAAMQT